MVSLHVVSSFKHAASLTEFVCSPLKIKNMSFSIQILADEREYFCDLGYLPLFWVPISVFSFTTFEMRDVNEAL